MVTRERVFELLKKVKEPELNHSLVSLNLVRDLMIKEQSINLTVALSKKEEETVQKIETEIKELLSVLTDGQVHIRFREMTDFERKEVQGKLSGKSNETSNQPPKPHTQPISAAVLSEDAGVEFIAIASGKGGVGKSTVTVNLAVALARKGKKVGIIDADIYGFSIPDMMGIENRPEVQGNTVIPVERHGVKVISMGFFVEDNAPVIWRGPMLGKMLKNFFTEVQWGDLDYMLLDLPPGTGDVALDVHQMIPQSKEVIVTTPHATASFVAARAGSMAINTNHEILGVVENMSYYQCGKCGEKDYVYGKGGGAKLAEELRTDLLAQIPLGAPDNHPQEPDFSPSIYKEDTDIGKTYLEVADSIINHSVNS
ncbi:Mrp/NBP35 family ATP-binding protein [Chengkuizengella marina]|uniref:Iron-sulfur cluster carrier protein n=1 Tax=Chengkuizengella marina TaxID=2507566 RepID=A0A6N9Q6A8_9BACL|nr:Mrp/NBP35 family ATP-binding protein [Chengkuizengella marina]NBI30386.1 MRP family ATP-binding protein [Chengkuizengella marina]